MSERVAPSVLSSWTRAIVDALLVAGVDVFKVLSEAGFSQDDFRDPSAALPVGPTARLWRLAVLHTGDPAFGLEVARHVNQTTFHGLGVAVLASATLREAMQRLVRYHRLVSDSAEVCLEAGPRGLARLALRPLPGLEEEPAHEANDALLSLIVRVCRLLTHRNFVLARVTCRRPAPSSLVVYENVYRCPIWFAAREDALWFDADQLDKPLAMPNPELARRNDEAVRVYLERVEQGSIVQQVRSKLHNRLADRPSAQAVARALGMSQRSMQRRLHECGTSYEAVLSEVRRDQACVWLREGGRSVGELAFALGFDDASAFARAFRRWTGLSPSAYRAEADATITGRSA